jgi:hypothetical protein
LCVVALHVQITTAVLRIALFIPGGAQRLIGIFQVDSFNTFIDVDATLVYPGSDQLEARRTLILLDALVSWLFVHTDAGSTDGFV